MAPKELPDTKDDTRAQSKLIEIRTIFMDLLRYQRLSELEKVSEDAAEAATEQRFIQGIQKFAPLAIPRQDSRVNAQRSEDQARRAEDLQQQNIELQQEIETLQSRIRSMSIRR